MTLVGSNLACAHPHEADPSPHPHAST